MSSLQEKEAELQKLLNQAIEAHQNGQIQEAEKYYQKILFIEPHHFDALQLMGIIAGQKQEFEQALGYLEKAIAINPAHKDSHFNRAKIYIELQQFPEALKALQPTLEMPPEEASIYYLAGQLSLHLDLEEQAMEFFKKTLRLEPHIQAMNDLGVCLQNRGEFEQAIQFFEQIIALQPDFVQAHNNLGNTLQQIQQWELALQIYQNALLIQPDFVGTYTNLASLFQVLGRFQQAVEFYLMALKKSPTDLNALRGLGACWIQGQRAEMAIPYLTKAIELYPDNLPVSILLAEAELIQGHFQKALSICEQALVKEPDSHQILLKMGRAKLLQGKIEEALQCTRQAAELNLESCNDYLWTLLHDPASQNEELFRAYREWGERIEDNFARNYFIYSQSLEMERPLRIGFLSPDFKQHSAQFFYPAMMEKLDRQQFQVVCYSDSYPDQVTEKFKEMADEWYSVKTLTDQQLAELIYNHKIDVLVDPGVGSTSYNRISVFCAKPAPIQINFFPMTSGLSQMDYLIGDPYIELSGHERFHSEKVLNMPDCLQCYSPPLDAPEISEMPFKKNQYITFGSFNRPSKLNPEVIRTWAQILKRVSGSKLILKGDFQEAFTRENLLDIFTQHQISPERIEIFTHVSNPSDHLKLYEKLDITLDPFPFGGHTTTYESFWMGVPVITLEQQRFFSRQALAAIGNLKLEHLIASNQQQYIENAVQLAGNIEYLTELRVSLRDRLQASPLCDRLKYAHHLESLFRQVWRNYCFKNQPL